MIFMFMAKNRGEERKSCVCVCVWMWENSLRIDSTYKPVDNQPTIILATTIYTLNDFEREVEKKSLKHDKII